MGLLEGIFGGNDSPPEYSGGMSQEYFSAIDKAYQSRYGRGIPGTAVELLKSNRQFADEFWSALNTPQDSLISANETDREKYKRWGMISDQDVLNYKQTVGRAGDLSGRLNSYSQNGYLDEGMANQIRGLISGGDYQGAGILLDRYFTDATAPKLDLPQSMQDILGTVRQQAGQDVRFDPSIVSKWLPTLQQANAPLVSQEEKKSQEYMNSLGRLFSGQTLKLGQDITAKYDMDALNKALAYGMQDYMTKQSEKSAAENKLWNYGMWETGRKDDASLRSLQNAWNNADTNIKRDWNLQDLYLNRAWENEDWYKNASLTKQIAQMSQDNSTDWTKFLQPLATVAAARVGRP